MEITILKRIESMHEDRERNDNFGRCSIRKGRFIEEIDFDKKTEKAIIKSRYEILDIQECLYANNKRSVIIMKVKIRNYFEEKKEAEVIADKILEKHGEILLASMIKCFVEGLVKTPHPTLSKTSRIFDRILKNMEERYNGKEKVS